MLRRHSRLRETSATPHPTREKLIEVTVDLVGEVGVEAVETAEVLERAGVTTGALYHHFRDMNHLLEEAMARRFPVGVRESLVMLKDGLAQATNLAYYQQFMRNLTEVSQAPANRPRRTERAHYVALAFTSDSFREVIAEQQTQMTEELTEVLEGVQERGWLRKDLNPKAVAVFIQAYTLGRIIDDISNDPLDPAEWNRLIVTVMLEALSDPSSGSRAPK